MTHACLTRIAKVAQEIHGARQLPCETHADVAVAQR